MGKFVDKFIDKSTLRTGYTTGACAAAATKAALSILLGNESVSVVNIVTPSGVSLYIDVERVKVTQTSVCCAVVKDSGDDPDVTNGIKVFSTVSLTDSGVLIDGGEGVGRVTLKGLSVEPGNAAINPVPYAMIEREITALCRKYGYTNGVKAVISVPEGMETAKKTYNARLGIIGGISILGTTGIVEPMSEKALIDSIRLEIRVMYAKNHDTLLVTPGNYGLEFIREKWGFDSSRGIKCSNFIGETLDYAVYTGFKSILLIGHVGKLIKLAAGIMNTHSSVADGRMEIFAAHGAMAGASAETVRAVMDSTTTDSALDLLDKAGLTEAIAKSTGEKIKQVLKYRTGEQTEIAFVIFRSKGELFRVSDEAAVSAMIQHLKEASN